MPAMNEKDYYAILGVSEDASVDEIRKVFQQKARTLHPDVNKEEGAEEKFKEISEAYAVLSDPDKRKRYDAMRKNPFAGSWPGTTTARPTSTDDPFAGWGGFPFGGFGMGGFGGYGSAGSYGSAPAQSHAYNPKPGADIVYDIPLDAERAKAGTKQAVTYQHYVACEACHGMGTTHDAQTTTCPTCSGTGSMTLDLSDLFLGFGAMRMTCPECSGTGKVVSNPCDACGGSGRILTADELVVDVPAGVHDLDLVRVKGKGNAGTNGREAGDFVARINVASERLTRSAASAFRILGIMIPFVFLFLMRGRWLFAFEFAILPVVYAGYLLYKEGITGRGVGWWRSGARQLLSGMYTGALFALLTSGFAGCTSGLGTRGYMG